MLFNGSTIPPIDPTDNTQTHPGPLPKTSSPGLEVEFVCRGVVAVAMSINRENRATPPIIDSHSGLPWEVASTFVLTQATGPSCRALASARQMLWRSVERANAGFQMGAVVSSGDKSTRSNRFCQSAFLLAVLLFTISGFHTLPLPNWSNPNYSERRFSDASGTLSRNSNTSPHTNVPQSVTERPPSLFSFTPTNA